MVTADLHVHTTNSDGQLTLDTIPAAARKAGVETVAVTDHDRLHPDLDRLTTLDGIQIVHGIELRVQTETQRVDLLGYGVRRTDRLCALVDRLQTNRIERAREILACVNEQVEPEIDVTLEPGVGRPHIARAIAESSAGYDYNEAFQELIGDGRPCFVARDIPSFEEGSDALADACDTVGLAHPFRYDDPESALSLATELDAVERYYPYDRDVETAAIDQLIDSEGLLPTGGSDAHEGELGRAGLDGDEAQRFQDRLDSRQEP
jgi:predicted metal-dependent phosphoesterase TrpH